jgi:hypothetical protein
VNFVVEIEVSKSEPVLDQVKSTNIDVNEIITKVRSFIESIKGMSTDGKPTGVDVEGFNFSFGKSQDEYDLVLKLNLSFKPKE